MFSFNLHAEHLNFWKIRDAVSTNCHRNLRWYVGGEEPNLEDEGLRPIFNEINQKFPRMPFCVKFVIGLVMFGKLLV